MEEKEFKMMFYVAIFTIVLCSAFIGYEFMQISKQGTSCVLDPMAYAQDYLSRHVSDKYTCACYTEAQASSRMWNKDIISSIEANKTDWSKDLER